MSKYMTKQRRVLLDFFSKHHDEQLSAKEVYSLIGDDRISISAIYRNLAALEQDGLLKKFVKSGSRDAFYQYTACKHCENSIHLSCKKCGHTFHMDALSADQLENSIQKNDGFLLNKTDTIIYGVCKDCVKT